MKHRSSSDMPPVKYKKTHCPNGDGMSDVSIYFCCHSRSFRDAFTLATAAIVGSVYVVQLSSNRADVADVVVVVVVVGGFSKSMSAMWSFSTIANNTHHTDCQPSSAD